MEPSPIVRLALAGNPNAGKTSLFNALTGLHGRVGNYPGVTIEKRSGSVAWQSRELRVDDLPGAYSLSPHSPEERIAREAVLNGTVDVVAVVVDSTNLRRHLYLLAQLMATDARLVLVLNMSDEAEALGQKLDLPRMENLLGLPVVRTVGHRGEGLESLKEAVWTSASAAPRPTKLVLGERLEGALARLAPTLKRDELSGRAWRFLALRLIEGDAECQSWIESRLDPAEARRVIEAATNERTALESEGQEIQTVLASATYGFVNGLLAEVLLKEVRPDARAFSDRLDAWLCHRALGPVLFLAAMFGLFWVTFSLGALPSAWLEAGFSAAARAVGGLWPQGSDSPLRSLLVDGLIAGVGGVLSFLPNILLLFFGLAFLEDSGYMARAAFLVDKVMHHAGLHGKSFIPLVTGFGCTVPGVMATRILENERDRLATMMVLPLISCGARLPIWMLLIPAFFSPGWRSPMLMLIYLVGIVLAVALARLLRVTLLRGEDAPFVMELPPYRRPTLAALLAKTGERGRLYLRKAGTTILGLSIILWAATSYPRPDEAAASPAARLEHSVSGHLGRALEPLLEPMGADWRVGTALIGAFAAKEVFVSQMGIVFSLDADDEGLRASLARTYTPAAAFSLMLFLLVATPCMATLAVTRRESGSWKWPLLQAGGLTALGWLLATAFYQGARLVMGG